MAIAYSCILIAVLLPYLWTFCAKFGKSDDGIAKRYDNREPRAQQALLKGYRARANWAQLNAFEAMPGFIGAVLAAIQTGVPADQVNTAALVFVVARVLHGVCYLANLAWQRSLVWMVGLGSVIWLLVQAIQRVA